MIRFGSVCSGIEAASVAWHPVGWRAAWLSEIEPFPCAVLAHHYPAVPNHGDMTALPSRIASGEAEAPEVFCGGTPCQAFSVAGLRQSLSDDRGNLSLTFCEIANAIDSARSVRGEPPAIVFWENVPGVLSTKDNAFGCFLAGLTGEDEPLQPAGGRWPDAGCVLGPKRAVAWRILDAQYFGLAQRRRRVFVVASAREGFDPAAVLFEFEGVRRDTAPSREAGKVSPTIPSRSTAGGGLGTDFDLDGGVVRVCPTLRAGGNRTGGDRPLGTDVDTVESLQVISMAHGQGNAEIGIDRGPTLTCNHEAPIVAHALRGEGFDASEDGTGTGTPLVPVISGSGDSASTLRTNDHADIYNSVAVAIRTAQTSANEHGISEGLAHTLDQAQGQAIAFAQNSRDEARLMNGDGQIVGALAAEPGMKQTTYVAFAHQAGGTQTTLGYDPEAGTVQTLGANQTPAVAIAPSLTAANNPSRSPQSSEVTQQVGAVHAASMQVRRLTPRECERLQGFPDDYTAIPWRGKAANQCPDGPRYKSLGNSWAVPVVRWIGQRINLHLEKQ